MEMPQHLPRARCRSRSRIRPIESPTAGVGDPNENFALRGRCACCFRILIGSSARLEALTIGAVGTRRSFFAQSPSSRQRPTCCWQHAASLPDRGVAAGQNRVRALRWTIARIRALPPVVPAPRLAPGPIIGLALSAVDTIAPSVRRVDDAKIYGGSFSDCFGGGLWLG